MKTQEEIRDTLRRLALARARELVAALAIGDDAGAGTAWGAVGFALADVGLLSATAPGDMVRVAFTQRESGAGRSSRTLAITRRPKQARARRLPKATPDLGTRKHTSTATRGGKPRRKEKR